MLLLDKPAGLTSNAALQAAKRLIGARKAGHGGTLDPLASGLLPVLFGEATKFAAYVLDADKEYLAQVKLGERTTTGDAEGEVVERRPVELTDAEIERALETFRGDILQVPPMYSALKRGGQPLYRLARQGRALQIEPRGVRIRRLELTERHGDLIGLDIACSKGTYIRSLAEDIGKSLGCGAHLAALRRGAAGGFRLAEAVSLDALEAMAPEVRGQFLLSLDRLLAGMPRIELDVEASRRFETGQAVDWPGLSPGPYAVYRASETGFIGVGEADGGRTLRPRRLIASAAQRSATG